MTGRGTVLFGGGALILETTFNVKFSNRVSLSYRHRIMNFFSSFQLLILFYRKIGLPKDDQFFNQSLKLPALNYFSLEFSYHL